MYNEYQQLFEVGQRVKSVLSPTRGTVLSKVERAGEERYLVEFDEEIYDGSRMVKTTTMRWTWIEPLSVLEELSEICK